MTTEIEWKFNLPVEKSDDAYLKQYFAMSRDGSRRRMASRTLEDRSIGDSISAMIAYIDRVEVQDRLWKFRDDELERAVSEYRQLHNLSEWDVIDELDMRRIQMIVAQKVRAEVHTYFSRFWNITQSLSVVFVEGDRPCKNKVVADDA